MLTSFFVASDVFEKVWKSVHNLVKLRAILTSKSLLSGSAEEVQTNVLYGIKNVFLREHGPNKPP